MNWTQSSRVHRANTRIAELPTPIGKAGASESVAIVAIIWGIVIIV